ncbi:MAG: TauD/TfdA family dioxygenase [Kiloniellales bacterium]|nr:TauD/TfdA family dioxygenase [Kiloniellales bacterium]
MLEVHRIDLSHEETPVPGHALGGGGRAWTAREIDPAACIHALDRTCRAELTAVVRAMRANPLPLLLRAPADFELAALRAFMADVKARLDGRPGVAVVDALPLDELDLEDAKALFWILGQYLGRPVAQKWDGTMLYDVRDTGQAYGYGVRGSYTNVELVFHTDNAFGCAPPDYVGLLCLRPAVSGGVSRFCSLYAVHDRLLAEHPALLGRLYRSMLWDRQAEHAESAPKVAWAPMFRWDGAAIKVRANVSLVRKGYAVAGVEIDAGLAEALEALEAIADDQSLWFELPIERGQLQYLNNSQVAHYRSHFDDHEDPALKRHLIRTWHRDAGRPSYDG